MVAIILVFKILQIISICKSHDNIDIDWNQYFSSHCFIFFTKIINSVISLVLMYTVFKKLSRHAHTSSYYDYEIVLICACMVNLIFIFKVQHQNYKIYIGRRISGTNNIDDYDHAYNSQPLLIAQTDNMYISLLFHFLTCR